MFGFGSCRLTVRDWLSDRARFPEGAQEDAFALYADYKSGICERRQTPLRPSQFWPALQGHGLRPLYRGDRTTYEGVKLLAPGAAR